MERVWFKLRQTDYPPEDENTMGTGKETAPLCLGHFIADLKRIDFVVNRGEIEEFSAGMAVYSTTSLRFEWHDSDEAGAGIDLGGGADPVAAASVKLLFRREVGNWEEYDRLDTYIVQPDRVYVAECLEGSAKLSAHVAAKRGWPSWSLFMITGVKVARRGKRMKTDTSRKEGDITAEGVVPTVASVHARADFVRGRTGYFGGDQATDFVWAVRLAKVSKGLLMRDWSLDPYTSRATFGAGGDVVDVQRTVAGEGLENFEVVEDEEHGEALVVHHNADHSGGEGA